MDFSEIGLGIILVILSFILMPAGLTLMVLSYVLYKVPEGYALVSKRGERGRITAGKWTFYLSQPGRLIPLKKETLNFPTKTQQIELSTPDEGALGVKVSVTYSTNDNSGEALNQYYATMSNLEKLLEARTQSALNSWVKGKPLPGTLKRALTMKDEAENFVRAKLTSVSTGDALAVHNDAALYFGVGYPVSDLGICVHEVHITEMQELRRGTGRADWGDGEEAGYNAQNIFKQFSAHADNLSSLRQLKVALIERYKEEENDIEDIYDQVRISMKESRDR